MSNTWKGWYEVEPQPIADALIAAKAAASVEHGDTPIYTLMTPEVRSLPDGNVVAVLVIGRPDCGWERNGGTCDKPKGHAGRHRYFRWTA